MKTLLTIIFILVMTGLAVAADGFNTIMKVCTSFNVPGGVVEVCNNHPYMPANPTMEEMVQMNEDYYKNVLKITPLEPEPEP